MIYHKLFLGGRGFPYKSNEENRRSSTEIRGETPVIMFCGRGSKIFLKKRSKSIDSL